MPTEFKATLLPSRLVVLTLGTVLAFSEGASILETVFFPKLLMSLLTVIAAFAIRLVDTPLVAVTDAGIADPSTLASRTFRNTGFELTIIPSDFALFERFCGDLKESTCCPMI